MADRRPDSETRMPFPVLIADIGGTNARFAIVIDSNAEPKRFEPIKTADYPTLDAAIERGQGAPDIDTRALLAKAVVAPRGPQWVCDKCNHIHGDWTPICANCGAFDTLAWKTGPTAEVQSGVSTAMLPLIVGSIEDKSAESVEEPEMAAETAPEPAAEPTPGPEPEDAEILPPDDTRDEAPRAEK